MSKGLIIYLALWFIVYPLLLIIALFIAKTSYARYREYKRRKDHIAAVRRFEDNEKKIQDALKTRD